MEGQDQAPPLDGVARDPLVAADELHPMLPPAPLTTAEDVLPSGTEAPVAPVAPSEACELPLLEEVVVEEDVLPVAAASSEAHEDAAGGVVLTDELRDQIVKQVEYYFSDENLPTDEFLLKHVKKNKQGFVHIGVIASFRRMKKLVKDHAIIEAALRTSSKLVVSSDGKRVRRLHPLPHTELKDAKKSTVVVENLPPDFSLESLQEKFSAVGKVVNITIHDPHSVKESATPKNVDFILSSKVHALVEYEAVEAAEKAVSTLNDERNWRTGLKVGLMAKRSVMGSGKFNQSSKENQNSASKRNNKNNHNQPSKERNNHNQPSKKDQNTVSAKNSSADSVSVESSADSEHMNSVLTPKDELQNQKSNAKGGRKGGYRDQGKCQIQENAKGQGGSCSESLNKPVPGPRMPDGTRGFTLGRGRPLPLQKSEKFEE